MYLTKWHFYSDLEDLTAPWPHLGAFLCVSPPTWECICTRGDFLGVDSPQTSSHSLWERICLPRVPCTWLPWAWPSCWSRIYTKGVFGAAGALLESGCPILALSLWPWSHLFLLFITLPDYWNLRPSHGVAPSMVFPTHGYGLSYPWVWSFLPMGMVFPTHGYGLSYPWVWSFLPMGMVFPTHGYRGVIVLPLWYLTLATPWLGDASSWRRWHLASLQVGDALCWLCQGPGRWLWPWLSHGPGTGRYTPIYWFMNIFHIVCLISMRGL